MLSILIPTYNYNAFPLAEILEKQALRAGIVFELICVDDGSFSVLNEKNQNINTLTNSKFIENIRNLGRNANRQLLAQKAQYGLLLFVDADVTPKHPDFLRNYLETINEETATIFGGFAYQNSRPEPNKTLRYTFGKHREEVKASIRNNKPYKVIISANFIIKKRVFLEVNREDVKKIYGLDYLFGALLKLNNIKVAHIDNEVYHLGIDDNLTYLEKTKKAVEALSYISKFKKIKKHDITLLKAYRVLKVLGLKKFFGGIILKYNRKIEANLLGGQPSLFIFDLYRLGYFCRIAN